MYLFSAHDIQKALNLRHFNLTGPFRGICTDSRIIKPSDIFIALKGESFDGHDFVTSSIFEKKAAFAIVNESEFHKFSKDIQPFLVGVEDTLKALQQLSAYVRQHSSHAKRIAITGSVGKTTTKEILGHVLSSFSPTIFAKESFNNHIGVPLSLLELEPNTSFGVFEIGMNHPKEIEPLSKLVAPHVAIITTIGEAHVGHMGTLEDIALEKSNIFTGLTDDGIAILHEDTPHFNLLKEKAKKHKTIAVGSSVLANIKLLKAEKKDNGQFITIQIDHKIYTYQLALEGLHNLHNSLLVVATLYALNLDISEGLLNLSTFKPIKGRGQYHSINLPNIGRITLIDDAYNANPTSMRAGLSLIEGKNERTIAILGEMLELGEKSPMLHKELGQHIAQSTINQVFCCGSHMKDLFDELSPTQKAYYAAKAEDLFPFLLSSLQNNDIVYVKGSKGSKVSSLVQKLLDLSVD